MKRLIKSNGIWLLIVSAILWLILFSTITNAQPIKATIEEIIANPANYDGKMVSVEGRVEALRERVSQKGNPYTTFKISQNNRRLAVISFNQLSLKDGDSAKVVGRYQIMKHIGQFTFENEIETSDGSVEAIK